MVQRHELALTPAVVWLGKLAGCAAFEPILERLGYKKTVYLVCMIQIVAIISESPQSEGGISLK